jgi:DNA mismatch endonuclease, patch repair protein
MDTCCKSGRYVRGIPSTNVISYNHAPSQRCTKLTRLRRNAEKGKSLSPFTRILAEANAVSLMSVEVPDFLSKKKRSELMARVRSSGNKGTELRVIQFYRGNGITGWRRGSNLPGKPDFIFPRLKVAVFVDGCFWHGCPTHGTWPKNRAAFWLAKITGNKARDRRVNRELSKRGWIIVRIWEHELLRKDEARLLVRLASSGIRSRNKVMPSKGPLL